MSHRLQFLRFTFGPFAANTYLVIGPSGREALLVDPGLESEPVLDEIRSRALNVALIANTHGHLDHVACNAFFRNETGAPIAIHAADKPLLRSQRKQGALWGLELADAPEPDRELRDGEVLEFDGSPVEVIHTPGHTPGGVCLRLGDRLLVGDTLFRGSVGRTDLPGGNGAALLASIRTRILVLPDATVCLPGHGPETTVGEEKRHNPFLARGAGLTEISP